MAWYLCLSEICHKKLQHALQFSPVWIPFSVSRVGRPGMGCVVRYQTACSTSVAWILLWSEGRGMEKQFVTAGDRKRHICIFISLYLSLHVCVSLSDYISLPLIAFLPLSHPKTVKSRCLSNMNLVLPEVSAHLREVLYSWLDKMR